MSGGGGIYGRLASLWTGATGNFAQSQINIPSWPMWSGGGGGSLRSSGDRPLDRRPSATRVSADFGEGVKTNGSQEKGSPARQRQCGHPWSLLTSDPGTTPGRGRGSAASIGGVGRKDAGDRLRRNLRPAEGATKGGCAVVLQIECLKTLIRKNANFGRPPVQSVRRPTSAPRPRARIRVSRRQPKYPAGDLAACAISRKRKTSFGLGCTETGKAGAQA